MLWMEGILHQLKTVVYPFIPLLVGFQYVSIIQGGVGFLPPSIQVDPGLWIGIQDISRHLIYHRHTSTSGFSNVNAERWFLGRRDWRVFLALWVGVYPNSWMVYSGKSQSKVEYGVRGTSISGNFHRNLP